ncbi:C10 family peptidase, partial [Arthrospira platensis SPKY1]|nr:C10 family peptidase [Arthrospira platensis SPKY1]
MQYACWGSGITLAQARTRIIDAFRNTFGYSNPGLWYDGDTWGWTNIDSYIYDEVCISYSRPVLMIGFNQNGGHAWVCNGVERRWSCRNGRRIQWYLNYMDWGWNGAFNGWFAGWGLFPERPA